MPWIEKTKPSEAEPGCEDAFSVLTGEIDKCRHEEEIDSLKLVIRTIRNQHLTMEKEIENTKKYAQEILENNWPKSLTEFPIPPRLMVPEDTILDKMSYSGCSIYELNDNFGNSTSPELLFFTLLKMEAMDKVTLSYDNRENFHRKNYSLDDEEEEKIFRRCTLHHNLRGPLNYVRNY